MTAFDPVTMGRIGVDIYPPRTGVGLEDVATFDREVLPVDLAASLGAAVLRASTVDDFRAAIIEAKATGTTTVVPVETDPFAAGPPGSAWWDVPVNQVSELDTRKAYADYADANRNQRPYPRPPQVTPEEERRP